MRPPWNRGALWKATSSPPPTSRSFSNAEKQKYQSRILDFAVVSPPVICQQCQLTNQLWAHAGSSCVLSGSWVTVPNAKHVPSSPSSGLTPPCAVPSDYFNIIHNTASPSPTSAVWNSLLSVSHINPPTASKLPSKNLSPVTSQLSWFLSSSVIFMWSFILMEISPRKLGMCHQLPFSHVF